jgi:signal transduction histidine kinase
MATLLRTLAKRFRDSDQKRATAMSTPSPLRLASYVFMRLVAFGQPAPGGGRTIPWSRLARELENDFAVPALSAWQLANLMQLFELDIYADAVILRDEEAARARLARDLGYAPT